MKNSKTLSRVKPLRTMIRANKVESELKDIRCEICNKILFQSFSEVHIVVPGHPDTLGNPALLDPSTMILQCHGSLTVMKSGHLINTRCSAMYFVT